MSKITTIVATAALLLGGCAMDTGTKTAAAAPVRVLVEIAVPANAPSATAIGDAQAAVIAALPSTGVRVVRRYESLPVLALEMDPALVPSLLAIPSVMAVKPDRIREPMAE
jgi:hypothetical protein